MYAGVIVETADIRTLFKSPKHPYTKGLLNSIPRMGQYKFSHNKQIKYLPTIKGSISDYSQNPDHTGCRYNSRCPHAKQDCLLNEPELITISKNHAVRCILYQNKT